MYIRRSENLLYNWVNDCWLLSSKSALLSMNNSYSRLITWYFSMESQLGQGIDQDVNQNWHEGNLYRSRFQKHNTNVDNQGTIISSTVVKSGKVLVRCGLPKSWFLKLVMVKTKSRQVKVLQIQAHFFVINERNFIILVWNMKFINHSRLNARSNKSTWSVDKKQAI